MFFNRNLLLTLAVLTTLNAGAETVSANKTEEARCRPNWTDGKMTGYLCSEIGTGSSYYKAGLRSGDLVTAIDGVRVTGPAIFAKLFDSVDKMKFKEIRVRRAGAELTLKPAI